MKKYQMWIGGKRVDAVSGKTFSAINPATGEEIARIPLGSAVEVNEAVEAARKTFPVWSKKSQAERSKIMNQIAVQLREHAREFAEIDVINHGTPVAAAERMIEEFCQEIEYAASLGQTMMGEIIPSAARPDTLFCLQREPIGVCALIVPWNFPLGMIIAKLGGALTIGNTCIIKPPSLNSMIALKLIEIFEKTDLPAGAVNIVTGPGNTIGEALDSHPGVDMVSFTGGTEAGKSIMATASKTLKRLCMELGGKNPFIVLDDADLDMAAKIGVLSLTVNTGQACTAPGRFYVHEKVYYDFVDRFVAEAKKIIVGNPADVETMMGPVVSAEHRDGIESYIKSGIEEGAKLILGGKRPTSPPLNKGYFVMPTVLTEVTQSMKIAREEIFGPVAPIIKFSSDAEAIEKANDNAFGLCASVWTKNVVKGIKFADEISAGTVWINNHWVMGPDLPWGGFKGSGFGKEHAALGMQEYTQVKLKAINYQMH